MNITAWLSCCAMLTAGHVACAESALDTTADSWPAIPGASLPTGWMNIPINDKKPRAQYALVNQSGAKVLHARAERAASMLLSDQRIDLETQPIVHWKWRLGTAPANADIAVAAKEDSAARLVFLFDGDVHRLSLVDRLTQSLGSKLSGREMPYATLMYVSSERYKSDTRLPNPYTRRVQMIVVHQHHSGTEQWRRMSRNVAKDYEAVFGEKPGRLIAYGLMTDSDNTATFAESWYANVGFMTLTQARKF